MGPSCLECSKAEGKRSRWCGMARQANRPAWPGSGWERGGEGLRVHDATCMPTVTRLLSRRMAPSR
ncbi:hypothetical protein Taro_009691 [Colocasia esculenta]|uniref:Uncharacterized protein n=1 Tax=Colocasia esculenta TaxID=4460 RepID=A0A843U4R2_COLES|nr:hypothetical protein [Colocasia esculenta]